MPLDCLKMARSVCGSPDLLGLRGYGLFSGGMLSSAMGILDSLTRSAIPAATEEDYRRQFDPNYGINHKVIAKEQRKKAMLHGRVRPIGRYASKCEHCNTKGIEYIEDVDNKSFTCSSCGKTPTRFCLDVYHKTKPKSKRYWIYNDIHGSSLDTYERSFKLLSKISEEINDKEFDPAKYVRAVSTEYYAKTLLDRYYNDKINSIAPSYKTDFKRYVDRAKAFFKDKDIRDIRKLHIIDYVKHLETKFTLSPKTIKNTVEVFKAFMRYCLNDIEIVTTIPPFPKIEVTPPPFRWLQPEDQIKLFNLVPDKHKPVIAFLMLHGCRPSEGRALKVRHVDIKGGTISISATFSGNVYREKRKGKNAKAVIIPIHPELYDFLVERCTNNLPEAFIFINPNTGTHYHKNVLQKIWDGVRTAEGIDKSLRLYDATRHSFASNLVNSGSTIYKVSKLLGHSSTKMTEKYSHSEVENLRTDLNKLSLNCVQTVYNPVSPLKKSNENK